MVSNPTRVVFFFGKLFAKIVLTNFSLINDVSVANEVYLNVFIYNAYLDTGKIPLVHLLVVTDHILRKRMQLCIQKYVNFGTRTKAAVCQKYMFMY